MRLKGIVLTTDSLLLAKRHPGLRMFRLTAAQLSIGGIRLTQQDGDRTPTIAEIEVSAPHVDIVRNFSDSVPPVDSLQRASGQTVRTIGIGRLRIADGSVTYCEIRNGRQTCHMLRGLSVQTDDFRLNAGNANDSGWLDNGIRTSVESVNYQLDEGAGRVAGRYADNRHPQRRMLSSGRPPVAAIPEKRIRLAGSRPSGLDAGRRRPDRVHGSGLSRDRCGTKS